MSSASSVGGPAPACPTGPSQYSAVNAAPAAPTVTITVQAASAACNASAATVTVPISADYSANTTAPATSTLTTTVVRTTTVNVTMTPMHNNMPQPTQNATNCTPTTSTRTPISTVSSTTLPRPTNASPGGSNLMTMLWRMLPDVNDLAASKPTFRKAFTPLTPRYFVRRDWIQGPSLRRYRFCCSRSCCHQGEP